MRKPFRHLLLSLGFMLLLVTAANAQPTEETCPPFIQATLENVLEACEALGRDQICYGNVPIESTPHSEPIEFSEPGDIEDVDAVTSLRLSGINLTDESWGVALMQVKANLEEEAPQNVSVVLFGDVSITNIVPPEVTLAGTTTAAANIRTRPTTDVDNVLTSVRRGQVVVVDGRLADSSWLRVSLDVDQWNYGWMNASVLNVDGNISDLNVVRWADPRYGPFQAFQLETGTDDRPCAEAPDSGILIQTPQGVGTINIQVNDVLLRLGSTVYVRQDGEYLEVYVLDGAAVVSATGISQFIPEGSYTTVAMADLIAAAAPELPEEYDADPLLSLPISLLPEPIEIAVP